MSLPSGHSKLLQKTYSLTSCGPPSLSLSLFLSNLPSSDFTTSPFRKNGGGGSSGGEGVGVGGGGEGEMGGFPSLLTTPSTAPTTKEAAHFICQVSDKIEGGDIWGY